MSVVRLLEMLTYLTTLFGDVGLIHLLHTSNMVSRDLVADYAKEVSPDLICGPRCVHFILKHFGIESDLIELTKAAQWPDLESGASLKSLSDILIQNGLHTRAIKFSPSAKLNWDFPVIFHRELDSRKVGHFAVWLPESTLSSVEIWDGIQGKLHQAESSWRAERSGVVLLVAPAPISTTENSFCIVPFQDRFSLGLTSGVLVFVAVFLTLGSTFKAWRRKCLG